MDIKLYVLGHFHLQMVNKLYRKYKPVRGSPSKNLELRNYPKPKQLHNYQTETAIFLAIKQEKTIMSCSYLNFSIQKIHQNSKKWWLWGGVASSETDFEAALINFCCYKYIIVPMLLRQFRSED